MAKIERAAFFRRGFHDGAGVGVPKIQSPADEFDDYTKGFTLGRERLYEAYTEFYKSIGYKPTVLRTPEGPGWCPTPVVPDPSKPRSDVPGKPRGRPT